jgi:hypothetical protein
MLYQQRSAESQSNNTIFTQGPSITTSGVLATASQPDALDLCESTDPVAGHTPTFMSPDSLGISSNPSYGDEFPLFSLLTDLDAMMPDPFLISTE